MLTARGPDLSFTAAFLRGLGDAALASTFLVFRAPTFTIAFFFAAAFFGAVRTPARFAAGFFAGTLVRLLDDAVLVAFLLAAGFPRLRDVAVFLAMGAGKVS
ncbi:MAG: hypothetical protein ACO1NQ_06490 [Flavobacteriales bacterium]